MASAIKKLQNLSKKIPIHPSFLLLFLWFVICGRWGDFFIFISVVLTHELGHYFVAKRLGYRLDHFFVAPYGVSISFKDSVFENKDEIKIALAGPIVNLTLATLCVGLWWVFPEIYNHTQIFVSQSLCLGLFNLLPAYPMDGGRVLTAILSKFTLREKALKLTKILNVTIAGIFFALFVISCAINFNPTFMLAAAFMILGVLQADSEQKYKIAALVKKKNKNFSRACVLYVDADRTLAQLLRATQQNRYTIFYVNFENSTKVIDEKIVIKLSLSYPLSTTLAQIFEKQNQIFSNKNKA